MRKPYVDDGPPIPLPSRDELLAMELPFTRRCTSIGVDEHGDEVRQPIIVRFATAEARWRRSSHQR